MEHGAELPMLCSGFPLAICFTHGNVYMLVKQLLLSRTVPHVLRNAMRNKMVLDFVKGWEGKRVERHKKIKSVTVSIVSPSICHDVMGLDTP